MVVVKTYPYDVAGRTTAVDMDKGVSGLQGPNRLAYTYDAMGRVTEIWQDVRKPQNYATTDSSPSDFYTDQVQWNLGKMYERQDVSTHCRYSLNRFTISCISRNTGLWM